MLGDVLWTLWPWLLCCMSVVVVGNGGLAQLLLPALSPVILWFDWHPESRLLTSSAHSLPHRSLLLGVFVAFCLVAICLLLFAKATVVLPRL